MDVTKNIARGRGVTLWRQIVDTLRADVETGILKPGDQLPTEPELAERFKVNRHTVRRAMAVLAERGLLTVEQGRGTFVKNLAIPYVLGRRTRFSANLHAQGRGPGHQLIGSRTSTASAHVAAELGLEEGAPVIRIETLSIADGTPLTYGTHEFPVPRFAGIDEAYRRLGSLTDALAELGVADYTRRLTRLIARMPTAAEATHLGQSIDRPVLQSEAVNVDADGTPIQHSLGVFAGDRVQMIIQPDDHGTALRK
jgi:GntR family phosphonate transport system transcriptional regulator